MIPSELETTRLHLRPWRPEDAAALRPILLANHPHLAPWIPAHVAEPASLSLLTERLTGFADDFAANRSWRYAFFDRSDDILLGEISLFARNATGRVPLAEGDRAEVGYWLRADRMGKGLVTEGARAMVDAIARASQFTHIEIRCDARNAASWAVAVRLGFTLVETHEHLQVWRFHRS